MKAVIQRVSSASVSVEREFVGRCGKGLLVLVAAHREDTERQAEAIADRVWGMRIFNDDQGKMNLALKDLHVSGEAVGVLAVSNFTVLGDTAQRRPSFVAAATYEQGKHLFETFVAALRNLGCPVETGVFGAHMEVELVNDGPVTLVAET